MSDLPRKDSVPTTFATGGNVGDDTLDLDAIEKQGQDRLSPYSSIQHVVLKPEQALALVARVRELEAELANVHKMWDEDVARAVAAEARVRQQESVNWIQAGELDSAIRRTDRAEARLRELETELRACQDTNGYWMNAWSAMRDANIEAEARLAGRDEETT